MSEETAIQLDPNQEKDPSTLIIELLNKLNDTLTDIKASIEKKPTLPQEVEDLTSQPVLRFTEADLAPPMQQVTAAPPTVGSMEELVQAPNPTAAPPSDIPIAPVANKGPSGLYALSEQAAQANVEPTSTMEPGSVQVPVCNCCRKGTQVVGQKFCTDCLAMAGM